MDAALRRDSSVPPSITWSIYAGFYLFACATATALLLSDVLGLLAEVLGLPAAYWMVVLASPALVVGAVAWWAAVERRRSYTYLLGSAVGLVTALLTALLWTARFVASWGFEMLAVPAVSVLATVVVGVAAVAGGLAGLPLVYARRRLARGPSDGTGPAG